MIAAVVLLGVAGYGAMRGLVGIREAPFAATLGVASAWGGLIVLLNLILRAHIPFHAAAFIAFGAIVGIGAWGWRRAHKDGAAVVDGLDVALLGALASAVSALVLLYQFIGPDSDNFIHYPLVALFMRGQFPHVNPYFPDVPLYGHYGRDLGLAGLLTFGGAGIGTGMMIEAWVLHLATVGNAYYLGKRAGGGRVAAVAATYLVFFGVNAGFADWVVRSGLAEVAGNNNPVVYAFFFAVLLLFAALLEEPRPATAITMGVLLGGLDMVYETHFDILFAALCAVSLLTLVPTAGRSVRPGVRTALTASLALAFVVMLVSGGLTGRMIVKRLDRSSHPTASSPSSTAADWALAGAQQNVSITFPKHPFLTLTHANDGRAVPLLSPSFVGGQGIALLLLPAAMIFLVARRNLVGIVTGMVAILSLIVPASFDFGRFNGENFRFIFLGGLAAALTVGIASGEVFSWIRGHTRSDWIRWAAVAGISAACASQGSRAWRTFRYAELLRSSFPHHFRITEAERLQAFCMTWGRGDEEAAQFLRDHGKQRERLMTNYAVDDHEGSNLLNNAMVVMSQARLPMIAFNHRLQRDAGGIRSSVEGWSARTIAFWTTGDGEILRDLRPDWLYVVPETLSPDTERALSTIPGVQQAFRSSHGADRVIFRIRADDMPARPVLSRDSLSGTAVIAVEGLEGGRPEQFRSIWVRIGKTGPVVLEGDCYVFYRLFDRTASAPLDEADSIGTVRHLAIRDGGEQRLDLPFVFPYNPGDYEITIWIRTADGDVRIGSEKFGVSALAAGTTTPSPPAS